MTLLTIKLLLMLKLPSVDLFWVDLDRFSKIGSKIMLDKKKRLGRDYLLYAYALNNADHLKT